MADFKPGDVVQMASGGKLMTVKTVEKEKGCLCVWVNKNNKQQQDWFDPILLVKPGGINVTVV